MQTHNYRTEQNGNEQKKRMFVRPCRRVPFSASEGPSCLILYGHPKRQQAPRPLARHTLSGGRSAQNQPMAHQALSAAAMHAQLDQFIAYDVEFRKPSLQPLPQIRSPLSANNHTTVRWMATPPLSERTKQKQRSSRAKSCAYHTRMNPESDPLKSRTFATSLRQGTLLSTPLLGHLKKIGYKWSYLAHNGTLSGRHAQNPIPVVPALSNHASPSCCHRDREPKRRHHLHDVVDDRGVDAELVLPPQPLVVVVLDAVGEHQQPPVARLRHHVLLGLQGAGVDDDAVQSASGSKVDGRVDACAARVAVPVPATAGQEHDREGLLLLTQRRAHLVRTREPLPESPLRNAQPRAPPQTATSKGPAAADQTQADGPPKQGNSPRSGQ
jgi:hypothetical protein